MDVGEVRPLLFSYRAADTRRSRGQKAEASTTGSPCVGVSRPPWTFPAAHTGPLHVRQQLPLPGTQAGAPHLHCHMSNPASSCPSPPPPSTEGGLPGAGHGLLRICSNAKVMESSRLLLFTLWALNPFQMCPTHVATRPAGKGGGTKVESGVEGTFAFLPGTSSLRRDVPSTRNLTQRLPCSAISSPTLRFFFLPPPHLRQN